MQFVNRRYFQNLFIIAIIIIYLFANVNCNFAHEALRTRFNVSALSRFTFYLEFGNVFFFLKGKRIPEHQEKNLSEKGRENSNHISHPLRDLEHFKKSECSNHWAHPRREG